MLRRVFTVDEANSLIPVLEEVFRTIEFRKSKIQEQGQKLEVLGLLWGDQLSDPSSPDYEQYMIHKRAIANDVSEIEGLIQEEIVRRGIRFPVGGIENGLIDFPTTYQGRWVYLCWRSGEPELLYWHETDEGFRGRQEISEIEKREMGREDAESIGDDSDLDF
jgi:hypothetical protein